MPRPPADPDPIKRLVAIMAQLRDRETGCAWDIAQTFESIAPYTIEESYEAADAIERGDMADLKDELGDVLLQVVFHAQMADEIGAFGFDDVAEAICAKLIRRHPHVFSDGPARTPAEIKVVWDQITAEEPAGKPQGLIDDVPANFPSLVRAQKMQKRVSKAGLDWPDTRAVAHKVREEVAELTAAADAGDKDAIAAEFGDLLFTLVNVARHAGIDADAALTATNAKFARRVRHIEAGAKRDGVDVTSFDADEWDRRWDAAKAAETRKDEAA